MNQTRTSISRLVHFREVPCLPSNLRKYLCNCLLLSAQVDHGVGEHLIQRINPVILAVEPKFIADAGRSNDSFSLRFTAFRPDLRVIVHTLLHFLFDANLIWFWKSSDGLVVNWFFRGVGQTLLSNREWLCSSQPVVVSSDAASHCCIRLVEEVHSTSWNDAIC